MGSGRCETGCGPAVFWGLRRATQTVEFSCVCLRAALRSDYGNAIGAGASAMTCNRVISQVNNQMVSQRVSQRVCQGGSSEDSSGGSAA